MINTCIRQKYDGQAQLDYQLKFLYSFVLSYEYDNICNKDLMIIIHREINLHIYNRIFVIGTPVI